MQITTEHYIWLSLFMFTAGIMGVLFRRNAIVMFMSIELMLNAANLAFVAFSDALQNIEGQLMVVFVMIVAAAESAIGLSIVIALFRNKETTAINEINILKG